MREGAEQYGLSKSDYRVDARRELDKHTFVIDVRPTNAPRPNCPKCKDPMQKHGTKQHQLYHGSFDNKRCIINLTRQRWQCAKCKTTHLQRSPLIWPYNKHLSTNAAIRIAELLQTGVNAAIIAAEIGASKNSIQAVRRTLLASIEAAPLPRHLCIDEMVPTRNLYAKASKRMPDLVTCIYDGENSTLKDMIAGRSAPAIRAWAAQYSTGERMRVKVITCDMCWPFIRAMEEAFPGVPICVDKYHVVKRFKDAVIAERNRCFPPNEARTKGLALGSIRTLTKRESKAISESEQAKI